MATTLYPFQNDVVARAASDFKKMRDERAETGNSSALLISMPCGMGKTVVLAAFIREMLSQSVTFVLTPGKGHLAAQTYSVLKRELADTVQEVLLLGENVPPPSNPKPGSVIVTNYEKVVIKDRASGEYKSRISRDGETPNVWDTINYIKSSGMELVVAIDEAHYGSHGSRGRIGEFFNDLNEHYGSIPLRIETTATPNAKTRLVDVYTVESRPREGIKAGLLRNKIVLNLGRNELERKIREEFKADGKPEWAGSADIVLADLMYRQWEDVKTLIDNGTPQDVYNPLMLFCVSNAHRGEEEMSAIEAYLATKDITRANKRLAVHLTDDSMKFEDQKALTDPNSPVSALIFKQSIALGWDCPRAQFMLLTRKISEDASTFTEQLLGRIRRQVYGRRRGVDAIDTAYLYSMCDPVTIEQSSGIPTDTSDVKVVADEGMWEKWNSAGIRRTTTVRKGRSGGVSVDGEPVIDPLTRADIISILDGIKPKGTLSGDAKSFTTQVVGEQEVGVGKSIVTNMELRDGYRSILREKMLVVLRDAMGDAGVKGKARLSEISREPFLKWMVSAAGADSRRVSASALSDLNSAGYGGLVHTAIQEMCREVKTRETTLNRNHYEESEWLPYLPSKSRYHLTPAAAKDQGKRLHTYSGPLAELNLYGATSTAINSRSEDEFENEFLVRLADAGVLQSWLRNDKQLDSYASAFSLAYRKANGNTAAAQMFPDYLLLVTTSDGSTLPVVIEVKGSDNGRPVDASSDGSLDAKAKRLAELTSQDDTAYGSRTDTVDGDGNVIKYGRGPSIGAVVYRDKGQWRVHGQGAVEELGVWLKRYGVML